MGQSFSQQVMPPSEVYCPSATSRKNTGRPPPKRKMVYGMRKAPGKNEPIRERQTKANPGEKCTSLKTCFCPQQHLPSVFHFYFTRKNPHYDQNLFNKQDLT